MSEDFAREDEEPARPAIFEAWGSMCAWACDQRRDWDRYAVRGAMREASIRGAKYETVERMMRRLAWDLDSGTREVLAELSFLNRVTARGDAPSPQVMEALRAGDYQAARQAFQAEGVVLRTTGPQPALTDNDRPAPAGTP